METIQIISIKAKYNIIYVLNKSYYINKIKSLLFLIISNYLNFGTLSELKNKIEGIFFQLILLKELSSTFHHHIYTIYYLDNFCNRQ